MLEGQEARIGLAPLASTRILTDLVFEQKQVLKFPKVGFKESQKVAKEAKCSVTKILCVIRVLL